MNKTTYELAKELKDAGYPQSTENEYAWRDGKHCIEYSEATYNETITDPYLHELIEACNAEFTTLFRRNDGTWLANGSRGSNFTDLKGSTPEESVARLWLALNKK